MKSLKILAAGLLALAAAVSASATTLHVTGSTAFRKSLYAGIINQLGNGTVKVAYVASASGLGSANQATFTNGTDTVYCCMAGSVGGVKWVVLGQNVSTDKDQTLTAKAWVSLNAGGGSGTWATASIDGSGNIVAPSGTYLGAQSDVALATWDPAGKADMNMSDSFQDSTLYDSVSTGVAEVDNQVGVVTFVWAKGQQQSGLDTNAYNRFTNIDFRQAQVLLANGILPLSVFTSNTLDESIDVVLIGRDNDSGTRLATHAETLFGPVTTGSIQYQAYTSGNTNVGTGSGTLTIDHLWEAGKSATGSGSTDDQAGYSSGGSVKKVLQSAIASTAVSPRGSSRKFIPVGYLGTGDSPGAGLHLTWEGTTYSTTDVIEGHYTFWTEQHLYYLDTLASAQQTLAGNIATQIITYAGAAGGIKDADMRCVRSGAEGSLVYPTYP